MIAHSNLMCTHVKPISQCFNTGCRRTVALVRVWAGLRRNPTKHTMLLWVPAFEFSLLAQNTSHGAALSGLNFAVESCWRRAHIALTIADPVRYLGREAFNSRGWAAPASNVILALACTKTRVFVLAFRVSVQTAGSWRAGRATPPTETKFSDSLRCRVCCWLTNMHRPVRPKKCQPVRGVSLIPCVGSHIRQGHSV